LQLAGKQEKKDREHPNKISYKISISEEYNIFPTTKTMNHSSVLQQLE